MTFHLTNAVTAVAQVAIFVFAVIAYRRTREWGFALIALATMIYFWNVAFHYLVQFGVFLPEARWSRRDSDLIYAADAAVYIIGTVIDVIGIARICRLFRTAQRP
jgi:hypothetical protein